MRYWAADIICRRCASVPRDAVAFGAFEAALPMPECRLGCKSLQEFNIAMRCEWKAECCTSPRNQERTMNGGGNGA